jgi:hypothetical protein
MKRRKHEKAARTVEIPAAGAVETMFCRFDVQENRAAGGQKVSKKLEREFTILIFS